MKPLKILTIVGITALVVYLSIGVYYLITAFYQMHQDTTYVPCEQLPTIDAVEKMLIEHNDTRTQLEKLSLTNSISIDPSTKRCPGKAELVISYGTHDQREKIKKVIGDTFFGVPYWMTNV